MPTEYEIELNEWLQKITENRMFMSIKDHNSDIQCYKIIDNRHIMRNCDYNIDNEKGFIGKINHIE